MKKDSPVYVVVFTFVVCAVFVFFLALANEGTKDRAAANRLFAERSAVLDALGIAYSDPAEALSLYSNEVKEEEPPAGVAADRIYRAESNGARYLAARVTGAGLWGSITAVVGADADVKRLSGIQIVAQNETPGLGGRIEESWFRNQFKGERVGDAGIRVVSGAEAKGTGDSDPDNGLLDGISGASRTSQAMQSLVNKGIEALRATSGGRK